MASPTMKREKSRSRSRSTEPAEGGYGVASCAFDQVAPALDAVPTLPRALRAPDIRLPSPEELEQWATAYKNTGGDMPVWALRFHLEEMENHPKYEIFDFAMCIVFLAVGNSVVHC